MSINVDDVISNYLEMERHLSYYATPAVDADVQEIGKQLITLNPDLKKQIEEIQKNLSLPKDITKGYDSKATQLKANIHDVMVKAFPGINIDQKIKQLNELEEKFKKASRNKNYEQVEKVIKECQKLNLTPPFLQTKHWVDSAITCCEDYDKENVHKYFKLFLGNGAKITPENSPKIIDRFFKQGNYYCPDVELFELFLAQGFDINVDGEKALEASSSHASSTVLIFHGAGKMITEKMSCSSDDFAMRADALDYINRNLPKEQKKDFSNLTFSERRELARLCRQIYELRLHFSKEVRYADLSSRYPKSESSPEILKIFEHHKAFLEAYRRGDLDQAEKLMKAGFIDINGNLRGYDKTLLNDACLKGDVKLVEWLLKAGANPNSHIAEPPPLFQIIFQPNIPNHASILNLLLQAGADINLKAYHGFPWVFEEPLGLSLEIIGRSHNFDPDKSLRLLFECGLNPNLTYNERNLSTVKFPIFNIREYITYLIYYGFDTKNIQLSKEFDTENLKETIDAANKLVEKNLAEIAKQRLLKLKELDSLSPDVLGIIGSYTLTLQDLTPSERLALADLCLHA